MRRRFHPLALAMLVGTLVATACTNSDQDGYEQADRILAVAEEEQRRAGRDALPVPDTDLAPERLAASNCDLETREDEYGLEFEVCVEHGGDAGNDVGGDSALSDETAGNDSDDDGDENRADAEPAVPLVQTALLPVGRFDQLVSALPAGPGRDGLTELGRNLDSMDRACETSLEQWGVEVVSVVDQLELAGAAVAADPSLEGVVGSGEGRELARAVVERVMIPSGCIAGAPDTSPVGGLEAEGVAELSARAAAAVEPLYRVLWDQPKSPFFYHPDELAHRQWMREENLAGTELDLVVAGTSQTLLGIEADLLAEQLGLEAGNVSLPGAVAEVQQYWLPEVVESVEPSLVLWGIGPLDLVTICKPDGRAEEFARLSTLKQDVLGHLPAAAGVPALDLIVGPPGSDSYAASPTSLALDRRFPQPRGDAFEFAQPDPAELRSSLERFRAPFERADYCAERVEVIEATIAGLVERGHRVVVFGMPIAPSLAATHEGGSDRLSALVDQVATEVFEPAGAEYLGMMTSLDDDEFWYDVVHPTRSGGELLTGEVGTALAGIG